MNPTQISEPPEAKFVFADTRFSWFWTIVRLYVGYEWLMAGWEKVTNAVWTGNTSGSALEGFLNGALGKTSGAHPDVSGWYAYFIQHVALVHPVVFSYAVAYGELLVGLALVLGIFTGIAAFFGVFMNANYLFAGTVSVNPPLLILGALLMLAWRIAGWIGLDHWVLPALGVPWE